MLVYATRLWFTPSTALEQPLDVVARWLSRKVGHPVTLERLVSGGDTSFAGSQRIQSLAALSSFPALASVSYSHPDSQVSGRLWTTEVGLRRRKKGEDLECTVLLTTDEISARVSTPVKVTRPGLVTELVNRCSMSSATQGLNLHSLDEDSAEAFRHVVLDGRRHHSLIVLSPDQGGQYLSDPKHLLSLVLGLADVVVIPKEADTFWLARVIGRDFVPYHGATKLIYPVPSNPQYRAVAVRTLTTNDVKDLRDAGQALDAELLSLVVHRSNLPLSWAHISPQAVRDQQIHLELLHKREEAVRSGNAAEYARYLEELVAELEAKVKVHEGSIDALEKLVATQDDAERQLRFENDNVKQQLAMSGRSKGKVKPRDEDRLEVAAAIAAGLEKGPTPEQSLTILEHLFPDRVDVLPEAWQAARDSRAFKHGTRLFALLYSLATDYWDALCKGRPDAEARKVFGSAFAAKESERVEAHKGARNRRTFEYRGEKYEMMKHLKIGVKDSASETIRVHFEWLPESKLLLIGHCGAHIPFR